MPCGTVPDKSQRFFVPENPAGYGMAVELFRRWRKSKEKTGRSSVGVTETGVGTRRYGWGASGAGIRWANWGNWLEGWITQRSARR